MLLLHCSGSVLSHHYPGHPLTTLYLDRSLPPHSQCCCLSQSIPPQGGPWEKAPPIGCPQRCRRPCLFCLGGLLCWEEPSLRRLLLVVRPGEQKGQGGWQAVSTGVKVQQSKEASVMSRQAGRLWEPVASAPSPDTCVTSHCSHQGFPQGSAENALD